jgi:hypothetical protein
MELLLTRTKDNARLPQGQCGSLLVRSQGHSRAAWGSLHVLSCGFAGGLVGMTSISALMLRARASNRPPRIRSSRNSLNGHPAI